MTVEIRPATADDAETLVRLIRELAAYEQLEHEARATPEAIRQHLFGPHARAEALIAEQGGQPIGFALFFQNFSTFRCQPGLYLEDIYVQPEHRGRGLGKALFQRLAALAVERDCGRMEWTVLNWNEPAIQFYRGLGARPMDQWTLQRLEGESLTRLAHSNPGPARDV